MITRVFQPAVKKTRFCELPVSVSWTLLTLLNGPCEGASWAMESDVESEEDKQLALLWSSFAEAINRTHSGEFLKISETHPSTIKKCYRVERRRWLRALWFSAKHFFSCSKKSYISKYFVFMRHMGKLASRPESCFNSSDFRTLTLQIHTSNMKF